MRAHLHRLLPFVVMSLAVILAGRAAAQSNTAPAAPAENNLEAAAVDALVSSANGGADEQPDEITVQGKKNELGRYRVEMMKARDKIVDVFNKVNSSNDNDVTCRTEKPTGSRMGHSVCRSKAEDAADAAAARGMLDSLLRSSGGHYTGPQVAAASVAQVNALAGTSRSRQEGAAGEEEARAKLEAELKKMMAENRELFRAVVKYVEARDDYNEARGQGQVVYTEGSPLPE